MKGQKFSLEDKRKALLRRVVLVPFNNLLELSSLVPELTLKFVFSFFIPQMVYVPLFPRYAVFVPVPLFPSSN